MARIAPNLRASGYFVSEAAKLAGLSRVMVDYLCRSRLLVPTHPGARGRGRKRIYSFGDVVMLRALARLLQHGISVMRMKHSLQGLRERHPEITPTSLPAKLLISDGKTVFFRNKTDAVEDLATGQMAFAFVLELSALQREVSTVSQSRGMKRASRK